MALAIDSTLIEERWADHALDAYAAHLGFVADGHRNQRLEYARRFVRLYPDLTAWQRAPLIERLGSRETRQGVAFWCAQARPYLYFLVQTGHLVLDWPWIIGAQCHVLPITTLPKPVQAFSSRLCEQVRALGYSHSGSKRVERAVRYFFVRLGGAVIYVGEPELTTFAQALSAFRDRDDAVTICGSLERLSRTLRSMTAMLFTFRTALYHQGQINQPPRREVVPRERLHVKPAMRRFIERYAQARLALHARPTTVSKLRNAGRHLADWLAVHHPGVEAFAELTREQLLAYGASLVSAGVKVETQITRLSSLSVMFHDATAWGWREAPPRPLIGSRDLPKRPNRVPRFIPAEQLERLMTAIRNLECPYQRAALIIARWSGARRGEISRLELECLDNYLDGTPRLRVPAGKTATERMVPLHPEAAEAIRELQALARPARGFPDERSGRESPWLFVSRGRRLSTESYS